MTEALTCPRCGAEMRTHEHKQVAVDHCTGCGGIFLDHGELERLVEAETVFYSKTEPSTHQAPPPHRERRDPGKPKRKKQGAKSFLEGLLEL